ncbi:MAG TPA: hypothetical protein EYP67_08515 [Methanosarcinales archaeon]|nr:hypothetical protein [Methanosarcinales archaeon]
MSIANCEDIPESYTRSTNYYDVTGDPYIVATLVGDDEFKRGEDAILVITLQNYGAIHRIKGDKYLDPGDSDYDDEKKLAAIELGVEVEKSTADRVDVVLFADGAPIDVKVGMQGIESIEAGKIKTVRFSVHIDDNAPAGIYQLRLVMRYDHIRDVQVSGTPDLPDINYWKETKQQNQTITIVIEKEPDFEVTHVSSSLQVGETGFLNITYRNTGEETMTDAVARISDMLPFTAKRNQAHIGTLAPGEAATTSFSISVGRDAVPKTYSIGTGIRFKDADGDIRISDPMQIGAMVTPGAPFGEKLWAMRWWVLAAVLLLVVFLGLRAQGGRSRKSIL